MNPLLMIAATQGGGKILTPGPELWPQPGFDASTGLTLVHGTVTGGQFVSDNSANLASCTATAAGGTFTVGCTVQYSFDVIAINTADSVDIKVAGSILRSLIVPAIGTSTITGTVVLGTVTNQNMALQVENNDSGAVKFDNCSIKVAT